VQFEKEYFDNRKYSNKERLVKRHVLEVLCWASKMVEDNLLRGEGRTALDVGCACGYSSSTLEKMGYKTYAIDLSRWGVRQAKAFTNGDFVVCDAQTLLPFKDRSFDLVTCFDVLEHLQFPERTIKHMLGACNGTLVCTTPNRLVETPVKRVMRDYDETHINVRSASDWERRITEVAKLQKLDVETFLDFTMNLAGQRFFFKSLRLPKFGGTVRIVAKKI
jgi:SAM-dependent methyltransferase